MRSPFFAETVLLEMLLSADKISGLDCGSDIGIPGAIKGLVHHNGLCKFVLEEFVAVSWVRR